MCTSSIELCFDEDLKKLALFETAIEDNKPSLTINRLSKTSMGLRIRKKIKLFPGLSLNLSKSGISASVKAGPVSWNSRRQKTSINLPGPLSYQSASGKNKGATKADLVDIARQAGLTGYSKLKKQELTALLQRHSLL